MIQGKGKKSIMIMPLDVTTKMVLTNDLVDQMTRQARCLLAAAIVHYDISWRCEALFSAKRKALATVAAAAAAALV